MNPTISPILFALFSFLSFTDINYILQGTIIIIIIISTDL